MKRIAFCQTNRLFILLERAEKELRFSMANGTFKMKMDIDCHSPRLMPNNCTNLNPPYFSLLSTFNSFVRWALGKPHFKLFTLNFSQCSVSAFSILFSRLGRRKTSTPIIVSFIKYRMNGQTRNCKKVCEFWRAQPVATPMRGPAHLTLGLPQVRWPLCLHRYVLKRLCLEYITS